MFRWLMSRILRADLAPGFNWPEPSAAEVLARISIELPQPFLKVDTREQLLSQSGDEFVLYKRWTNQKGMALVRFR
ncbi:MAG: hypothetical protein KDA78_15045, partial [Planctomycetaceae bacterium]|nr:hypothetical protein [Planctomycetaceae bacterium]